ncbi:hypothetical protein CR194_14155 [Salipaludibacillus keqinensis]|uniref:DUF8042 domain-containing protein n=1 Tax=Salipaludibacillus keqinensis TaxID=2045207 RepID=A0A323TBR5_9BACI|nr:hypothetical protein [Salipaludibacillus keqinensis]PYZ92792.1 hypothetical protein CR194_14155 [Salipaludibacillus keqinensis]
MKKHLDVMKQSLKLSVTVLEVLTHVQKQLNETKYPDAMQLMPYVEGGWHRLRIQSVLFLRTWTLQNQ